MTAMTGKAGNTFDVLRGLVEKVQCKPDWSFALEWEDDALRLVITVRGFNSYNPKQPFTVRHFFPVPTATYNVRTWRRWIFEMCLRVENHEIGEWFKVDGERPFSPMHGPGENPYDVHEFRDEVDRRTLQDGSLLPR